jgi:hypothetical protein
MVLAKNALAQGAVMGGVRVGTKAIPVIGAVAGGATSYYFGSSVVKACREGFSAPMETWPEWLAPATGDTADALEGSRAARAMRSATDSAQGAARAVGGVAQAAAGTVSGAVSRVVRRGPGRSA